MPAEGPRHAAVWYPSAVRGPFAAPCPRGWTVPAAAVGTTGCKGRSVGNATLPSPLTRKTFGLPLRQLSIAEEQWPQIYTCVLSHGSSVDQDTRHGLPGSSAQGLTRLHPRCPLPELRVLFQVHGVVGSIQLLVVGGLRALLLCWLSAGDPKGHPQALPQQDTSFLQGLLDSQLWLPHSAKTSRGCLITKKYIFKASLRPVHYFG